MLAASRLQRRGRCQHLDWHWRRLRTHPKSRPQRGLARVRCRPGTAAAARGTVPPAQAPPQRDVARAAPNRPRGFPLERSRGTCPVPSLHLPFARGRGCSPTCVGEVCSRCEGGAADPRAIPAPPTSPGPALPIYRLSGLSLIRLIRSSMAGLTVRGTTRTGALNVICGPKTLGRHNRNVTRGGLNQDR